MEASLAVVTETWLTDGEDLDQDIDGLCLGAGLGMLCLNRSPNDRGFSHSGVAVVFKSSDITMRKIKLHNPHAYKVLVTTGILSGCTRRIVLVACYLPPNSPVARGRGAMEYVAGAVTEVK